MCAFVSTSCLCQPGLAELGWAVEGLGPGGPSWASPLTEGLLGACPCDKVCIMR